MNMEQVFQSAFWALFGLMMVMRLWFTFRVRYSGERLMPDRAAIRREGWLVFAIRCSGFVLLVALLALGLLHRLSALQLALPLPVWLRCAGIALGLAGWGLCTWTHVALGRLWSAQLQLRTAHRLVTDGPYSRIRHPMYTAIFGWIVILGLVIASWIPLVIAAWVAVIFATRAPREEQMMLERFGDEYRACMQRAGRFFPLWGTSP